MNSMDYLIREIRDSEAVEIEASLDKDSLVKIENRILTKIAEEARVTGNCIESGDMEKMIQKSVEKPALGGDWS